MAHDHHHHDGHRHHDHGAHGHAGHGHDHDHGPGHSHAPQVTRANARAVGGAALVTGFFMLVSIAGGVISGSLALLADAGHMLTDFASLALAWFGFKLAQRPSDWRHTYGFDRFAVLFAFVNGLALFVIAGFILYEAVERLLDTGRSVVYGDTMLAVAIVGLVANLFVFWMVSSADRHNLNVRAAMLHVAGDLLGSVAAVIAALVILWTSWMPIDTLLSVLIAGILAVGAWRVTRDAAHILLEGAPAGLEADRIAADLVAIAHVDAIEHVHIWSISQERPVITLQARISGCPDEHAVRDAIKARLAGHFGIAHSTVELLPPEG